ncbi:E3 ubiquitin-protein ligase CHFR-like [Ruditapes philippinarum]|uniref:E3 ubiquitin-protein ligase CHFR-like n=1 Tax=Ruditapes philippinarum TaxID=129788 RepID=UPI00295B898E|nr:E3 ubiquitin-protein ligase CHFR-like [Ruditapes philippinarum]
MTEQETWGQLVSLTDIYSDPILLTSDKYSIGRANDCDLSLSENKLVSGHHCHISREKDGKITLTDTSTNGTLLNMTYKVTKGKTKELQHGDEFYIVFKKDNEELNVGYIFQDLSELQKEEGTQEYSPPNLMDATLEDTDCNYISPERVNNKRKSVDNAEEAKEPKKAKTEETSNVKVAETEESKSNKAKDIESKERGSSKEEKKSSEVASDVTKATSSKPCIEEKDDIEENLQCMICQEIMHDCISLQPCLHSFCAGCYSDWMSRSQECPSCRKNVERINKNHIVNNLIEAYLKEHPGKRRPAEDLDELNKKNKITNDMLYPKNLVKQESSDYSDDDDNSDDNDDDGDDNYVNPPVPPIFPPVIQQAPLFGFGTPIFGVTRAYKTVCRQCPEYKDPDTGTGVIGGIKTGKLFKDENRKNNPTYINPKHHYFTALNNVKNLITGAGNQDNNTATAGTTNTSAEPASSGGEPSTSGETSGTGEPAEVKPSTSGDGEKTFKDDPKEMPTPPNHVCGPNQNHILCQCCLQPFPDNRLFGQQNLSPISCGICYRSYCHAYWGCRKADCLGCLNKFKEMNFGRKALVGIILDNQFESEIFRDYIDSKGLSVRDVLQECCREMDAGRFTVTAQGTHRMTSETPVCYACGLANFKQLALQFRKTLKREDLPAKAQNRPDCYWGAKCRTQKNKPHHARNFNHICDQTRQF